MAPAAIERIIERTERRGPALFLFALTPHALCLGSPLTLDLLKAFHLTRASLLLFIFLGCNDALAFLP